MKFCDKLPKLRKENNLSQELLADKLGVSRQAVSKWESGNSYPDMEKMIEMCKILNCTLEDLLDDGSIKESNPSNKMNFSNYLNDFLKFITKIYNMFSAMKFKDVIKCLLEIGFICFILWIIGAIVFAFFDNFLFDLFLNIPKIGNYLSVFFENISMVLLIIVGAIILFHLFKVRYLDYYVTVEDQNATEKVLEKPVDVSKIVDNSKKEKVIIRDPKHSGFSFFEFLARIVVMGIKIMLLFALVFCAIMFIILTICLVMGLYHTNFGIIFWFIAIAFLGLLGLNYIAILVIFNFLVSNKQNFKRIFLIIISSLLIVGIGTGLATSTYLNFEEVNELPKELKKQDTISIEMKKNLVLIEGHFNYEIDNSINDIKLVKNNALERVYYDDLEQKNYNLIDIYCYNDSYDTYKLLFGDLKNQKRRDYAKISCEDITVKVSKKNYETLMKNYNKYTKEVDDLYGDSEE